MQRQWRKLGRLMGLLTQAAVAGAYFGRHKALRGPPYLKGRLQMTTSNRTWLPAYSRARITRRKFMAGAAAGAGAAALIACGGGSGDQSNESASTPAASAQARQRRLPQGRLAARGRDQASRRRRRPYPAQHARTSPSPWTPTSLARAVATASPTSATSTSSSPTVAPVSTRPAPKGKAMRPHLARSTSRVSDDGLTYTFTLRRGVKFHPIAPVNGRVMDIDDWQDDIERYIAGRPQPRLLDGGRRQGRVPGRRHHGDQDEGALRALHDPHVRLQLRASRSCRRSSNANPTSLARQHDRHQLPHGRQGPALGHVGVQALR